eukprot:scaffold118935_cov34-Tisochrysis_lutea.AAC.1
MGRAVSVHCNLVAHRHCLTQATPGTAVDSGLGGVMHSRAEVSTEDALRVLGALVINVAWRSAGSGWVVHRTDDVASSHLLLVRLAAASLDLHAAPMHRRLLGLQHTDGAAVVRARLSPRGRSFSLSLSSSFSCLNSGGRPSQERGK